jgi:hypothetical protein
VSLLDNTLFLLLAGRSSQQLSGFAEKMLRKRLEDDLGVKLADKKGVIREEVGGHAVLEPIIMPQQAVKRV